MPHITIHWSAAQESADAMLRAAEAGDTRGAANAADKLEDCLARLWELREDRDIDWQTIVNQMQGVIKTIILENRAEALMADQCRKIVELIKEYLSPATTTIDDLHEVLSLIDDAGFDPYAAISARQ